MAKARTGSDREEPRRLPRGRHALAPEEVRADQRRRLIEAVPGVVSERSYEAMSVADIVRAAGVSRNAFYDNFGDKQECFAAASEACYERLLHLLEEPCKRRGSTFEERVETSLGAALERLAAEPEVARLLFVEAPGAGEEIALRYHEWLRRYGTLLRSAFAPAESGPGKALEIDQVIIGGIASKVAGEVLQGRGAQLRLLTPSIVAYVLAFSDPGRSDRQAAAIAPLESEDMPAKTDVQRKQAGL